MSPASGWSWALSTLPQSVPFALPLLPLTQLALVFPLLLLSLTEPPPVFPQELEESEERCDLAEQTLAKFRARGRGASAVRGASPVSNSRRRERQLEPSQAHSGDWTCRC